MLDNIRKNGKNQSAGELYVYAEFLPRLSPVTYIYLAYPVIRLSLGTNFKLGKAAWDDRLKDYDGNVSPWYVGPNEKALSITKVVILIKSSLVIYTCIAYILCCSF
jgi:hypothetical protein